MAKPKLVVFDLDYTLWPFWLDTHVTPPFHKGSDGKVYDKRNRRVKVYPDVPAILEELHQQGVLMGVASRTAEIRAGQQLLQLLGWEKYFPYREIFPGDKTKHFQNFHKNSGIPFAQMLFFDDEQRNVASVSKLGVTCIFANEGMSHSVLRQGLRQFAARHP